MAKAGKKWAPSDKQALMLNAALVPDVNRKISDLCRKAGVPIRTFYHWLDDPNFAEVWNNIWHVALDRHLPGVVLALIRTALSGKVEAAKLVLQLTGHIAQDGKVASPVSGNVTNNIQINFREMDDDKLRSFLETTAHLLSGPASDDDAVPAGTGKTPARRNSGTLPEKP